MKNSTDKDLLSQRRILNYRYYAQFKSFDQVPEWYLILEGLELKVRPGEPETDPKALNLTWEFVSYD